MSNPVPSLEAALAVPEDLEAECHCGLTPERYPVFGTRCPVIEHRARAGRRWRDAYIELDEYCRHQRAELAPLQDASNLWAYIYNRAVEAGTILEDDVVTAIVTALLPFLGAMRDACPCLHTSALLDPSERLQEPEAQP